MLTRRRTFSRLYVIILTSVADKLTNYSSKVASDGKGVPNVSFRPLPTSERMETVGQETLTRRQKFSNAKIDKIHEVKGNTLVQVRCIPFALNMCRLVE